MLGSKRYYKDLKKEVKRLEKNLSARAKNIEGRGELAFQYLPRRMEQLKREHSRPIKDMSENELSTYLRQLRNANEAKSSTVKGAIKVQEDIGYLVSKLPTLKGEQQARVWEMYGKIYQEFTETALEFKYDLLDVAVDTAEIYGKRGTEDVLNQLLYEFEDLEEQRRYMDDETYRQKVLQIIDRLRMFYL